jgi:hypothetical protein
VLALTGSCCTNPTKWIFWWDWCPTGTLLAAFLSPTMVIGFFRHTMNHSGISCLLSAPNLCQRLTPVLKSSWCSRQTCKPFTETRCLILSNNIVMDLRTFIFFQLWCYESIIWRSPCLIFSECIVSNLINQALVWCIQTCWQAVSSSWRSNVLGSCLWEGHPSANFEILITAKLFCYQYTANNF